MHVASCHILVSNTNFLFTNFLLEITYVYTFREDFCILYVGRQWSETLIDWDYTEKILKIFLQSFRRYKLPKFAPIGSICMLSESLPIPYIVDYVPFTIRKTVNVFCQCFWAHKLTDNLKVYIYESCESKKTSISCRLVSWGLYIFKCISSQ